MVAPETIRIFETNMVLLIAENTFQTFLAIFWEFKVFMVYSILNG